MPTCLRDPPSSTAKAGAVDDAERAGQVVEVLLAGAQREIGHADPGLGFPQAPRADRGRRRERRRPLGPEDATSVDFPVEPADRLLRVLDLVELDDAGPRPGREGDAVDDAERGEEVVEVGLAGALGQVGHADGAVVVPAPPPRVRGTQAHRADSTRRAVRCGRRPVPLRGPC